MPQGECNLASGGYWTEAIWQIRDFKIAIAQFFLFYVEYLCSRLSLFAPSTLHRPAWFHDRDLWVVCWRSTWRTPSRRRAVLSRPLDERQQSWLLGPGEKKKKKKWCLGGGTQQWTGSPQTNNPRTFRKKQQPQRISNPKSWVQHFVIPPRKLSSELHKPLHQIWNATEQPAANSEPVAPPSTTTHETHRAKRRNRSRQLPWSSPLPLLALTWLTSNTTTIRDAADDFSFLSVLILGVWKLLGLCRWRWWCLLVTVWDELLVEKKKRVKWSDYDGLRMNVVVCRL